jgi:hypothetical protein
LKTKSYRQFRGDLDPFHVLDNLRHPFQSPSSSLRFHCHFVLPPGRVWSCL